MLYRLYFSDATGRPLTLAGLQGRPALARSPNVWPETSTLYVRILTGHVPVADGGVGTPPTGIVGSAGSSDIPAAATSPGS